VFFSCTVNPVRRVILFVLAVAAGTLAMPQAAVADAPALVSGNGITVSAWRWVTTRTFEVDITTAKVAASSVNGPHRVRVTLPNNYFAASTTRFPVLYLLHGGAGGNSAQWTTGGGAVEPITDNKALITVMPDGGKVGWYTNWIDQSRGAQAWRDLHIDQLIGWIDANLRTIASKSGRAVAGLSMGGFGAVRYAQDRPDLFAYVASFSGAVDLSDPGTRSVIGEQAMQNGYSPNSPFGNPFPPFDTTWKALNPVSRAARLRGVGVALYVGSGNTDGDMIERTMATAAANLHNALVSAGVPHFYWNYGRPGPSAPYGCDGGHNFGCWNFALNDALPRILAALQPAG
jgi:S-formylglutathione hydrolase FrmB